VHLGVERFAVWALVGVVTNYFGLLDFGIGSSFVKYISEFYTTKDYSNINKIINTGFGFYLLFAAVIMGVSVPLLDPLFSLLKVPLSMYVEARFVFLVAIGIFCVSNAMGVFISIQAGLQRMDLSNKIAMSASVVTVAGTVFFLEKGYGLRGLIVNNALVFALTSLMYIIYAYKLLPQLEFRPFSWDKAMFKRIFFFGFKVQISRISGTITSQTDKILITCFLAIGLVTYYQLGSSVVFYAMTIPGLLVSALVPAFSEIEARGERKRLIESYLRSTKYLTFFTAPLFVFIAVAANRIMLVWMGPGYEQSVVIIQILAAAYVVNMLARVSSALCMAIEKPEYMMNSSLIMIAANIGLSILFIKFWGFCGVAWGTLAAVNAGTIYFLWKLHKNLDIPAGLYMRVTIPFFVSAVISAVLVYSSDAAAYKLVPGTGRIFHLAFFLAIAALFSLVYLVCVYYSKLFDSNDSEFLKEKFPVVYSFLRSFIKGHG